MNYLAKKLYELRTERALKQDELAEALGVSRQAVSKWEMGTGVPSLENLKAISEFFGVTIDSLVKDDSSALQIPEAHVSSAPSSPSVPSYSAGVLPRRETVPPMKTLINASFLILAYIFAYVLTNGVQYFSTYYSYYLGIMSLDALETYSKIQPYFSLVLNLIFSFPLNYLMTAVFRDDVLLISIGRNSRRRLPDILVLNIFAIVNFFLSFLLNKSKYYFAIVPFQSLAAYLIIYLYLTSANGFRRRPKVLLPALLVMIAASAAFAIPQFVLISSSEGWTEALLENVNRIATIGGFVRSVIYLAALTVLYDYGRIKAPEK